VRDRRSCDEPIRVPQLRRRYAPQGRRSGHRVVCADRKRKCSRARARIPGRRRERLERGRRCPGFRPRPRHRRRRRCRWHSWVSRSANRRMMGRRRGWGGVEGRSTHSGNDRPSGRRGGGRVMRRSGRERRQRATRPVGVRPRGQRLRPDVGRPWRGDRRHGQPAMRGVARSTGMRRRESRSGLRDSGRTPRHRFARVYADQRR